MGKHFIEWTRKEFEAVPYRDDWGVEVICDSLVILPSRRLHDSGYRAMDFIAIKGGKPLCRLSGCSDVIHINGIGGHGHRWLERYGTVPKLVPAHGWSIDCLPKSGLLHIFCDKKIICGSALSSFEIFADEVEK
jgi:hypothetical protein